MNHNTIRVLRDMAQVLPYLISNLASSSNLTNDFGFKSNIIPKIMILFIETRVSLIHPQTKMVQIMLLI